MPYLTASAVLTDGRAKHSPYDVGSYGARTGIGHAVDLAANIGECEAT